MNAMTPRHILGSAVFDVAFASEEAAFAHHQELAAHARERLLAVIDEVFDEVGGGGPIYRFDEIEIDLGELPPGDYREEMERRLRMRLRALLLERLPLPRAEPAAGVSVVSRERAELEYFEQFLSSGRLPWSASHDAAVTLEQRARQVLRDSGADFIADLKNAEPGRRDVVLRRLIAQFPDALLAEIAGRLAPAHSGLIAALAAVLARSAPALTRDNRRIAWSALLGCLLDAGGRPLDADGMVESMLERMARSSARAIPRTMARGAQTAAGRAPTATEHSAAEQLAAGLDALFAANAANWVVTPAPPQSGRAGAQDGATLADALLHGGAARIERTWRELLRRPPDLLRAALRDHCAGLEVRARLAETLPEPLLEEAVRHLDPEGESWVAEVLAWAGGLRAAPGDANPAALRRRLWAFTLGHLAVERGAAFSGQAYIDSLLRQSVATSGLTRRALVARLRRRGESAPPRLLAELERAPRTPSRDVGVDRRELIRGYDLLDRVREGLRGEGPGLNKALAALALGRRVRRAHRFPREGARGAPYEFPDRHANALSPSFSLWKKGRALIQARSSESTAAVASALENAPKPSDAWPAPRDLTPARPLLSREAVRPGRAAGLELSAALVELAEFHPSLWSQLHRELHSGALPRPLTPNTLCRPPVAQAARLLPVAQAARLLLRLGNRLTPEAMRRLVHGHLEYLGVMGRDAGARRFAARERNASRALRTLVRNVRGRLPPGAARFPRGAQTRGGQTAPPERLSDPLHELSWALFALVVAPCERAWRSGLPLPQRGNEGDLATFASASASEIPPGPPLKKGGTRAQASSTANANRALSRGNGAPARQEALLARLRRDGALDRLLAALPERLLTRLLARLRGAEHSEIQTCADALVGACGFTDLGADPARLRDAKWRFIFGEWLGQGLSFERRAFVRQFARHLAGLAGWPDERRFRFLLRRQLDLNLPQRRSRAQGRQPAPNPLFRQREILREIGAALDDRDGETPPAASAPAPRRPEPVEEGGDELFIDNAGLVLAAPYLPRLFAMLDLLEGAAFRDAAAAERAAHLLQYLVDGGEGAAEYRLLLNKILCGLPIAAPIEREVGLSDREKAAAEGLLRGMIENWKGIGHTSVAGLRETFLRRQGRMRLQDGAWQLLVAPKPFDMLLDTLPWSIAVIRHRWMERVIHVAWR